MRANIDRSPLFNGQIRGIGPRYCPSLEDKIVRFPDKERHQIFLEPEGLDAREIYVNGFSMSLPRDVQADLVHALPGLEDAVLLRPGYAVEYDFIQPTELTRRLETKRVGGLVSRRPDQRHVGLRRSRGAGTGRRHQRRACCASDASGFELRRDEAYIGILVDDLITKGCLEPYRMFTSRAEHRLLLRIDNADLRLTPRGREAGLVDDERWERFRARERRGSSGTCDDARRRRSCERRPAIACRRASCCGSRRFGSSDLVADGGFRASRSIAATPSLDIASAETTVKYAGYLRRQESEIERARKDERRRIPRDFPFDRVPGLSREVVQRLTQVRPDTLGHALRIPGVTPAAVAVLGAFVGRVVGGRDRDVARISRPAGPADAAREGADLRSRMLEPLEAYFRLLAQWNAKINLTALPLDAADRRDVRSAAGRAAGRGASRFPIAHAERLVRSRIRRRLAGDSAEDRAAGASIDDGRVEGAEERVSARSGSRARAVPTRRSRQTGSRSSQPGPSLTARLISSRFERSRADAELVRHGRRGC